MLVGQRCRKNTCRPDKPPLLRNRDQRHRKTIPVQGIAQSVGALFERAGRIQIAELHMLPLCDLRKMNVMIRKIFGPDGHEARIR